MKKLVLLIVLLPLWTFAQSNEQQELAKQTYLITLTSIDAATPEKRNASVKILNGIVSLTKNDDTFKNQMQAHKNYLENLSYFEILTANVSIIKDSLINAYELSYEKSKGKYYIEPGSSFGQVIRDSPTGIYLYIYINDKKEMYLEFVNYTDGKERLGMYKSVIEIGTQQFSYYLNWVKPRVTNAEYCSIETNTQNFLELFEAISNHNNEFKITFPGENGTRTQTLPKEIAQEINSVLDLYQILKISKTAEKIK